VPGAAYHATFHLPQKNARRLEDWFEWPEGLSSVPVIALFESDNPARWQVDIYMDSEPGEQAHRIIISTLQEISGGDIPALNFKPVLERDWVSESQKQRAPITAGRFVVYEPHFKDQISSNAIAIQLEAGQAFGSGSHETTLGCLLALDKLANSVSPKSVLDMGTGSGLLAIAMAKIWDCAVFASDIDPVAIRVAIANMENNGLSGIDFITCDGFASRLFESAGAFDIICANILAGPLIEMAGDITRHLAAGGYLILSGILQAQEHAVINAYKTAGLKASQTRHIEEWSIVVMQKN
jgi:ribosomal protein L11 methyltransferase